MTNKAVAIDGNEAAAYAAYALTEIAAIYPITPSSPMAEVTDEWAAAGKKNIFGQSVDLVEMQSEAGAVGAMHGALEAGSLATSFTSSQGLMLMIPVLYRIAGTKQPGVLHVASRTVGTHAMSIFGDHSDVMACRATGFALLSSGSVQEAQDLGFVAHLSAIRGRIPFMHFFDGFRTSHEVQKVELIDYDDIRRVVDWDALKRFRDQSLNPEHPTLRNTVQNPDIYFQVREANNPCYDALPEIVEGYLDEIGRITGRRHGLFDYYGDDGADRVIVAMGSVCGTAKDTIDYLNAHGEKTGLLQVHLYRPFSAKHFLAALPKSAKRLAVLDRVKEHGAVGEPLFEDIRALCYDMEERPLVIGGRYGLSSKDTGPEQIKAVFDELLSAAPKARFTIGIDDDVTGLSLPIGPRLRVEPESTVCCKFWGLGSDGTVGANKNSIKIISDYTDLYTQAYFEYDTKKSFGVTKSHLRFGKEPIRASHLIKFADFVACHNASYLGKYDIVGEIKPGGSFLLNCPWAPGELPGRLPADVKRHLAENKIRLFIIDANRIAAGLGLGGRINTVLQAAFFSLAGIIPAAEAVRHMKDAIEKTYGAKGGRVVEMNVLAIDAGAGGAAEVPVPAGWQDANELDEEKAAAEKAPAPAFIENILLPINAQKGDDLPVSAFAGYEDGTMPMGTSAYEKRGIAAQIPAWEPEKCLQCNLCAFVCPHGVARPYLMDEREKAAAPAGFSSAPGKGAAKGFAYTLKFSLQDCTGCGSCAAVCPAKEKALRMRPVSEEDFARPEWGYALTITEKGDLFPVSTVKGSQFKQPLLEFSGACAGCGETPYAKLLTQLFGDRIYWANATGCSQAWGASMPSIPYTVNKDGRGPAWSNSLFEDNAEFSLGMGLAAKHARAALRGQAEALNTGIAGQAAFAPLAEAIGQWLATFSDSRMSQASSIRLAAALESAGLSGEAKALADGMLARRDQLSKKSIWMYGGDGWAYDIGYGGLDHVFSMGVDVNVLVVDTEVYSNTGSQSSKATPLGAAVKFQASGKKTKKKDLGRQMMAYGDVYVAQVAMGANPAQLVKALIEADEYPGPALVIAYAPCTAHGIGAGMENAQREMKSAVDAGYWHLYRYHPKEGRPFKLDSPAPAKPLIGFLEGETRYSSLEKTFPENAKRLFAQAAKDAEEKYRYYKGLEENQV
ncbi:MAG: pyruvate:ferredoxin (flavodoxin) oxidoreductase [Clostridiales Family XIII bacterium]|nr:pyruvate:ferredoxin (flavodoxin) oxidoreductase [Clostridiales Family XIII bacterium]